MNIFKIFKSNIIVLDQFSYAALTLLFTSIFAVILTTEQFAELNLSISVAMILVGYFRAAINQPQAILFKNGKIYRKEIPFALIITTILLSIVFIIIINIYLTGEYILSFISVFPILIFINQVTRDIYSVLRNIKELFLISSIYLFVYILIRFSDLSLASYFVVLSVFIFCIYALYCCIKSNNLFNNIKGFFLSSWIFSRWIITSYTLFIFSNSLIPFVLISRFGALETKNYYIFMSILAVFNPLIRGFYLKYLNRTEKIFKLTKKFFYYSFFCLPVSLTIVFLVPRIFFVESIDLFGIKLLIIMAGIIWTRIIYFVIDINFNIAKKNKNLFLLSIIRFMPIIFILLSNRFSLEFLGILLLIFSLIEIFILYIIDNEKVAFNLS